MRKFMIKLIDFYQNKISSKTAFKCRFIPSCSQYSKICFLRFNFFKAFFLTLIRLIKCNPLVKIKIDNPPKIICKIKNKKLKK